jgi:NADH dehydrogenase [ubiquinone] 1 alpha subcomplex assembly factor 1
MRAEIMSRIYTKLNIIVIIVISLVVIYFVYKFWVFANLRTLNLNGSTLSSSEVAQNELKQNDTTETKTNKTEAGNLADMDYDNSTNNIRKDDNTDQNDNADQYDNTYKANNEGSLDMKVEKSMTLFDFTNTELMTYWSVVNDGVMGGKSKSTIIRSTEDALLFKGELSLANNGGFSSMIATFKPIDLSAYTGIQCQIRGDGNTYALNLRDQLGRVVHQKSFNTKINEWELIQISFDELSPLVYGRSVTSKSLDISSILSIQLIISDKQEGPFELEIKTISTY